MDYIITENPVHLAIIALFGAMIFVAWLNSRYIASFKILWLLRLGRLALATLVGGEILSVIIDNAYPTALYIAASLIYLSVESVIYWMAILATDWSEEFSQKFQVSNVSWSAQKRHINLKDKIISQGFVKSGSFALNSRGEDTHITTFDSPDKLVRLSVYFLPYGESTYIFSEAESVTDSGLRISTKSHCVFSGLDKTEHTKTRLVSLEGDPLKILKIHKKRLQDMAEKLSPMPSDILADFNEFIEAEILAGEKSGLINPKSRWDSEGVFTEAGKYFFWKNILKMKYLPFVR